MKKASLRLTNLHTNEQFDVDAEIPAEEWEVLLEFAQCADKLAQSEFVRAGMPSHYEIHWDQKTGFSNPVGRPPDAYVHEFLLLLRPLILGEERVSFEKAAGILGRRLAHPEARKIVKRVQKEFGGTSQAYYSLICNDTVLNSDEGLRLWLNGKIYHRDKEKQLQLRAMSQVLPEEMADAVFLDQLVDKALAVFNLVGFVRFLETGPGAVLHIPGTPKAGDDSPAS